MKDRVLTCGDLALCLKGRRSDPEREVSRGHSSYRQGVKGRRNRRERSLILWIGRSQMFARRSSPKGRGGLKPNQALAVRKQSGQVENTQTQAVRLGSSNASTSTISTVRCGPVCRVVREGMGNPYPDLILRLVLYRGDRELMPVMVFFWGGYSLVGVSFLGGGDSLILPFGFAPFLSKIIWRFAGQSKNIFSQMGGLGLFGELLYSSH